MDDGVGANSNEVCTSQLGSSINNAGGVEVDWRFGDWLCRSRRASARGHCMNWGGGLRLLIVWLTENGLAISI